MLGAKQLHRKERWYKSILFSVDLLDIDDQILILLIIYSLFIFEIETS